jgi:hypothetical protein
MKTKAVLEILERDDMTAKDRLKAVLDENLIPAPILREFACEVAERVLACVKDPDPRSTGAIMVTRKWLRGEATDEELYAAGKAARYAANDAEWAANAAEREARIAVGYEQGARNAVANAKVAHSAAMSAAHNAAYAAAWTAEPDAADAAREVVKGAVNIAIILCRRRDMDADYADAEREEQIKILISLLRKSDDRESETRTEKEIEISERIGKERGMKTNEVNLGKFRLTGLNEQIDLLNKAIDELKYAADVLKTSREKALTLIHEAALISPKLVVTDE